MHKCNIRTAKYQNDYKILLTFDNGIEGIADLKSFLFKKECGIFKRLQDEDQFKDFTIDNHTLAWGSDLDFAPEFLYDLVKKSTDNCT